MSTKIPMSTKIAGRVVLALGFLAASVSYSSWIVSRTALDPSATRGATHALIAAPSVRKALARQLHDTLAPALGNAASDPKLNTAINAAVADPRFVSAFDDAIANLHAAILSDAGGQVTLDTRAVTAALRAAVVHHDPALAARVRSVGMVTLPLGGSQLPHIGGTTRTVGRVGTAAALIALVLIGGALFLVHDRKMVGRVGRRVAFLALGPTLMFAVAPRLLDVAHADAATVAAAILRAYGHRVLLSAVALAVIGVSTWLITLAVPVVQRRNRPAETPRVRPLPAAYARASRERFSPDEPPSPLPEKLYL